VARASGPRPVVLVHHEDAPCVRETSRRQLGSYSRETVSRFFRPCIIELNFARFVLSPVCSWFFCRGLPQVDIIWLILSYLPRSLPPDGDARVRCPWSAPVATSLMARIWVVSEAGQLVDVVGQLPQVPVGWVLGLAPSLPSMPTSRAHWRLHEGAERVGQLLRSRRAPHLALGVTRASGRGLRWDRGHHARDAAHLHGQVARMKFSFVRSSTRPATPGTWPGASLPRCHSRPRGHFRAEEFS